MSYSNTAMNSFVDIHLHISREDFTPAEISRLTVTLIEFLLDKGIQPNLIFQGFSSDVLEAFARQARLPLDGDGKNQRSAASNAPFDDLELLQFLESTRSSVRRSRVLTVALIVYFVTIKLRRAYALCDDVGHAYQLLELDLSKMTKDIHNATRDDAWIKGDRKCGYVMTEAGITKVRTLEQAHQGILGGMDRKAESQDGFFGNPENHDSNS